ncbi:TPA: mannonate dehydratase, partial [Streptococcus pyogenes]|nr:mannonate dehydratase [Streptococcus pyogenes]HER1364693.1 mannonate dehydratase [Streptococcus pyogenes]
KTPGYGLYDRALGATYFNGLYEANMRAAGKIPDFGITVKTVGDK